MQVFDYEIKRGYSKREASYMYGVYKDNQLVHKYVFFYEKNAVHAAEWLTMADQCIVDQMEAISKIIQILKIDRGQRDGKPKNRN